MNVETQTLPPCGPVTCGLGLENQNGWNGDLTQGGLPAGLSFLRSSSGCYFDGNGTLALASGNVVRQDFAPETHLPRGVLLEKTSTNLIRNNRALGTARSDFPMTTQWCQKGGNTVEMTDTLLGTVFQFTEDTSTGAHVLASPLADTPTAATTRAFSVLIKAGTATKVAVSSKSGFWTNDDNHVKLDLAAGTILGYGTGSNLTGATLTPVGNGWYRVQFVYNLSAGSGFTTLAVQTLDTSNKTLGFTGTGRTFLMALPQEEPDGTTVASSLIPTGNSGVTVTRAYDVLTLPNVAAWGYTLQQGVLIGSFMLRGVLASGTQRLWELTHDASNKICLEGVNGVLTLQVLAGGTVVKTMITGIALPVWTPFQVGVSYKGLVYKVFYNGALAGTLTCDTLPPQATSLCVGGSSAGDVQLGGWVRRLGFAAQALDDSAMATLVL